METYGNLWKPIWTPMKPMETHENLWLVLSTHLKNVTSSVGRMKFSTGKNPMSCSKFQTTNAIFGAIAGVLTTTLDHLVGGSDSKTESWWCFTIHQWPRQISGRSETHLDLWFQTTFWSEWGHEYQLSAIFGWIPVGFTPVERLFWIPRSYKTSQTSRAEESSRVKKSLAHQAAEFVPRISWVSASVSTWPSRDSATICGQFL